MKDTIEVIKGGEKILAIILHADFNEPGVHFFTPEEFPQQLGFIRHQEGEIVQAHIHQAMKREIELTQETILVKKGRVKVNLYDSARRYVDSRVLAEGDVMLLSAGGHEMKFLEETELIEIKQGPYLGKEDKVRFQGIEES